MYNENNEERFEESGETQDSDYREQPGFKAGVLTGIAIVLVVCASIYTGYRLAGGGRHYESVLSDKTRMSKLEYIQHIMETSYLEEPDEDALAEGIYTGLVYGLGDPYSRYYTAEEYKSENEANEGAYTGIGVVMVKQEGEYALITGVYEGSPAYGAGIREGDEIRAMDGEDTRSLSSMELVDRIRSASGEVVLTLFRESTDETLDVTVTAGSVEIPSVQYEMMDERIGCIRILEFNGMTSDQFSEAMEELRKEGMEALVVDLRGNPGGLVSSVCGVLRQILPRGIIVYTENRAGERVEETCDGLSEIDIPMAVLVNDSTASAAEIFAGAVQDYGLGPIVGTTTYGKGIVQTIHSLSDGSAVKLTEARYYTPDGHNIHGQGITPDIVAAGSDEEQMAAAIRSLSSKKQENAPA